MKGEYLALRHRCPDLVRTIRAAFDAGISCAKIKQAVKKTSSAEHTEKAIAAINYMAVNPLVGRVRWDGPGFVFLDPAG